MKKLLTLAFIALMLPLQASANGVELWEEGTHYKVISDTATSKPEVLEFFSFWCPHCHQFEPLVKSIKSKLDSDVDFKKVHVNFMGFTSKSIQDDATRAMMIGRALKQEDVMNTAIFNYIHKQRASIAGLNDLRNIFIVNGVDGDKFDKLAKGFGVNSLVSKNDNAINQYRRYVSGVPNFIVNGKYQAVFTRSMTPDDMINLVVWLSKQK